jgi:hypothetical protein
MHEFVERKEAISLCVGGLNFNTDINIKYTIWLQEQGGILVGFS